MHNKIIEHFISLTKIPHCSKTTHKLLVFLEQFAKDRGYLVEIDGVNNILIKPKEREAKLALQAHYDMVCMGNAPMIETYIEEGWMYAKDSSLGADNGMAIAMMMELMERGEILEFLLTSDEEIGLVGASAIALELSASFMLNLDFEEEGLVCIGCAGGADLLTEKVFLKAEPYGYSYEVSISGLQGGHSGVEIHKNIPNAIKLMVEYLVDKSVKISSFYGGERRNSIPTTATVRLSSKEPLEESQGVSVTKLSEPFEVYESEAFLNLLMEFKHGVATHNEEFNLPDTSINLAIVAFENGLAKIETTPRAMSDEGLSEIIEKNAMLFKAYGFKTTIEYKYPAWKPEINGFTSLVNDAMVKEYGKSKDEKRKDEKSKDEKRKDEKSKYKAIHAGLECGVLLNHYPTIKFASIGPTILSPHSTHEKVKLDSVGKIFRVVEEIIANT
jgi:dipeptidase D